VEFQHNNCKLWLLKLNLKEMEELVAEMIMEMKIHLVIQELVVVLDSIILIKRLWHPFKHLLIILHSQ
jgi:hypothetical protein